MPSPSLSPQALQDWSDQLAKISLRAGIQIDSIDFRPKKATCLVKFKLPKRGAGKALYAVGTLRSEGVFAFEDDAITSLEREEYVRQRLGAVDPLWYLPPEQFVPRVKYLREAPQWDDEDRHFYFCGDGQTVAEALHSKIGGPRLDLKVTTAWAKLNDPFRFEVGTPTAQALAKLLVQAESRGVAHPAVNGNSPGVRLYRGVVTALDRSLRSLGRIDLCG